MKAERKLELIEQYIDFIKGRAMDKFKIKFSPSGWYIDRVDFEDTPGEVLVVFEESRRYDPEREDIYVSSKELDMGEEEWKQYIQQLEAEHAEKIRLKAENNKKMQLVEKQRQMEVLTQQIENLKKHNYGN